MATGFWNEIGHFKIPAEASIMLSLADMVIGSILLGDVLTHFQLTTSGMFVWCSMITFSSYEKG